MTDKEKRISGLRKHNQDIKEKKANDVKKAINKLKKQGEFTLADLCREAGVSRQYFSKNPDMRELADRYITPTGFTKNRNVDSNDAYIKILKAENRELKKAIEKIKKDIVSDNKYKEKYEQAMKEIDKLKEELKQAYRNNLPGTF